MVLLLLMIQSISHHLTDAIRKLIHDYPLNEKSLLNA